LEEIDREVRGGNDGKRSKMFIVIIELDCCWLGGGRPELLFIFPVE
jgi:hypothetical protein